MNSDNILDEIWEAYQTTRDSLKIASRSIERSEDKLLYRTDFIGLPPDTAIKRIEASREDADNYVILSMWATFERKLYYYLQNECNKMVDTKSSDFNIKVHGKLDKEIEYWKLDDILDIFKSIVNPDLIGNAKKIKKYRDWIAHRNTRKSKPDNITPLHTYQILSDILNCLETTLCY